MDLTERARIELATALLAGGAGVVGSFLAAGRTPAFVGAAAAAVVTDRTPGAVTAAAIALLGDLAQPLAFLAATGLAFAALSAVALAAVRLGRRSTVPYTAALAGTAGGWLATAVLSGRPGTALAAGVAVGAALAVAEFDWSVGGSRPVSASRRKVLAAAAAIAGVGGLAYLSGGGGRRTGAREASLADLVGEEVAAEAGSLVADTRALGLDVEGLEPLVSEDFYEVDINAANPNLAAERFALEITGAVEREVTLSYADLLAMEPEHRFVTLRCVGESLNGHKMDNALWTGVSVPPLLEHAGLPEECCVMLRAADGYFEEFPLDALRDGFLAYGMNGDVLPREHGYPLRALVPGHWGEINVKWLTEIEVLDEPATGYWERRGWHGTGPVNTVAKLHAVDRLADGRVRVGGHAYAGTRGVRRVEVSTDGGETWHDATLSARLPGEDVWRQWAYEYDPPGGEHEVVVRAVEADGTVQPREYSRPFPRGATGWVSKTIEG